MISPCLLKLPPSVPSLFFLFLNHPPPPNPTTLPFPGVAAVDATLEEIESYFLSQQWGTVTAFLINHAGETIYHPLLKPNNALVDDPIFIPVTQLEQDKAGEPVEFKQVRFGFLFRCVLASL